MLPAAIKVLLTAALVVAIAEVAKRSTFAGAVLASIPLTSVLALIWLYADTGDTEKVAALAGGIFWLVRQRATSPWSRSSAASASRFRER
jgi:hypothetical protein